MADIKKEIKDFKEAVYGEEVRESMISLAEKVNIEATTAKNSAENAAVSADLAAQSANEAANDANIAIGEAHVASEDAREAVRVLQQRVENGDFSATISGVSVITSDPGTQASVENIGTDQNANFVFTIPKGEQGEKGEDGKPLNIKGAISSEDELPETGILNDGYILDEELYLWTGNFWANVGKIQGPPGKEGPSGPQGSAAGFGTPTATVDAGVGTPSVTVTASGEDTEKVFNFAFHNLKGEPGEAGETSVMTGATESSPGTTGLVPAPAAGQQNFFLQGDGTWGIPEGAGDGIYYGTCETEADVKEKIVDCPEFELKEGAMIAIRFRYSNTADMPNLNVNGTGPKSVYYQNNHLTGSTKGALSYQNGLNGNWWLSLLLYTGEHFDLLNPYVNRNSSGGVLSGSTGSNIHFATDYDEDNTNNTVVLGVESSDRDGKTVGVCSIGSEGVHYRDYDFTHPSGQRIDRNNYTIPGNTQEQLDKIGIGFHSKFYISISSSYEERWLKIAKLPLNRNISMESIKNMSEVTTISFAYTPRDSSVSEAVGQSCKFIITRSWSGSEIRILNSHYVNTPAVTQVRMIYDDTNRTYYVELLIRRTGTTDSLDVSFESTSCYENYNPNGEITYKLLWEPMDETVFDSGGGSDNIVYQHEIGKDEFETISEEKQDQFLFSPKVITNFDDPPDGTYWFNVSEDCSGSIPPINYGFLTSISIPDGRIRILVQNTGDGKIYSRLYTNDQWFDWQSTSSSNELNALKSKLEGDLLYSGNAYYVENGTYALLKDVSAYQYVEITFYVQTYSLANPTISWYTEKVPVIGGVVKRNLIGIQSNYESRLGITITNRTMSTDVFHRRNIDNNTFDTTHKQLHITKIVGFK